MIEVDEINPSQLEEYLNKGYEFICTTLCSGVQEVSVQEEVPVQRTITTGTAGSYYQHQAIYTQKPYPVTSITTKILIKRTQAAKLLYEKSIKNENNS